MREKVYFRLLLLRHYGLFAGSPGLKRCTSRSQRSWCSCWRVPGRPGCSRPWRSTGGWRWLRSPSPGTLTSPVPVKRVSSRKNIQYIARRVMFKKKLIRDSLIKTFVKIYNNYIEKKFYWISLKTFSGLWEFTLMIPSWTVLQVCERNHSARSHAQARHCC